MNRRGLIGLAKFGGLLVSLIVIIAVAGFYISSVFAASAPVGATYTPTLTAPNSNTQISFNITNNDSFENITEINITFPTVTEISGNGQFTYITSSQNIVGNFTNLTFSNDSGENTNLSWTNITDSIGFVNSLGNSSDSVNVTFNVSLPDWPGSYNFTVTVNYSNGTFSTTNITVTVIQPVTVGSLDALWGDSPGLPPFFWVNITNDVDFFYYDSVPVIMVANFTSPVSGTGVTGLNVTADFSAIGNDSGNVSAVDLGGGLYQFNVSTNYSNVSGGVSQIQAALINLSAFNGTDPITLPGGGSAPVILVNMSTMPSCPPANDPNAQLPTQIPWDNGTLFQIWNVLACQPATNATCVANATSGIGPAQWNETDVILCGPVWGSQTTNFSSVAASPTGNFSNIPLVLEIPGVAMINFTGGVDFAGHQGQKAGAIMEFAMQNLMSAGRFGINESEWNGSNTSGSYKPNMNITAQLTLYDISGQLGITDPGLFFGSFNGSADPDSLSPCPESRCTGFSWDGENLTMTVTSFSTYIIGDVLHNLTYVNLSTITQYAQPSANKTYILNITHYGNQTREEYNITAFNLTVNATVTTLNDTFFNQTINGSEMINLTINSTAEGTYQYIFRANHYNATGSGSTDTSFNLDSNNQTGMDNITLTFIVDGTAPQNITVTNPANNTNLSVNYININVSFNETYPDRCTLVFNNGSVSNFTATNDTNSTCVFNVTNQQDSGTDTYNYSVFVNDSAGNENYTGLFNVTIDLTAPAALNQNFSVTPINNSNITSRHYFEVNFSYTENHPDTCIIEIGNGSLTNLTMTLSSSDTWCYLNITNQADRKNINFTVYMNDTAGNSESNGTFFVNIDTTGGQLLNWTYSAITRNVTLTFNETMDASTIDITKFNITSQDGSVVSGSELTSAGTTATTANSSVVIITLNYVHYSAIEAIGDTPLQIYMASGALKDITGTDVSAKSGLNVTTYTTYNITIPEPPIIWSANWHDFSLAYTILQTIGSLSSDYNVSNVLNSMADKYTIIYSYDGSSWTSYVPGAAANTLLAFNSSVNPDYYIKANDTGRIEIV